MPIVKRIYASLFFRLLKLFKKEEFLMRFMGVKFYLNINEPIDKSIILFDYYENEQLNFSINLISKHNVNIFFDIGANCGIYSLIVANKFNNLKIYSFEPIKLSYKKFRHNIMLNKNLRNIRSYNYGLSNKNANLEMKALIKKNYIQLGGFGVLKENDNLINKHLTSASFRKGDDYFKFKNKVIFLKIDVEGHEMQVLEGIINLFSDNKIILQIEILPGQTKLVEKKLTKLKFKKYNKINFDYYFIN
ncbi:FkbM family methyltransferase [Pelagibacterales bacterium SAG-MED24]|nr:FkbM family methyltransferase [Pelagibacterales bacterium SAG-MED24]